MPTVTEVEIIGAHLPSFMQPKDGFAYAYEVLNDEGEYEERWAKAPHRTLEDTIEGMALEVMFEQSNANGEFMEFVDEDFVDIHDAEAWAEFNDYNVAA